MEEGEAGSQQGSRQSMASERAREQAARAMPCEEEESTLRRRCHGKREREGERAATNSGLLHSARSLLLFYSALRAAAPRRRRYRTARRPKHPLA